MVRERLLGLLDEAVSHGRLTLVCAPAGSGKTALVSTWATLRTTPGPLLWVTTDAREKGRRGLWQRVARGLEDSAQRGEVVGAAVDRKRLAAATRRLAGRTGPVVLVLDEGARPADPALHRELDQYLKLAGDAIRLVLVTRADPMLPLHRYRLARALSEIRVEDLRFTSAEARDLMNHSGVEVTDAHIATLLEKTGGWPAGLTFAVNFLQGQQDVDLAVRTFTGSDRAVSDFLVTEFLDAQPPNVREVLLRSSVVDELTVGLFEALTGAPDGQAVLAFLNRTNTFLSPAPGSAYTYQYPPLLREFLRTRLAVEHPELVPELHDTAARWWFRNGSVHEAVGQALAAGRWDQASRYVVDGLAIGEILNDKLDTLAGPFSGLPPAVHTAPAAVVRAALALRRGATGEARALLGALRRSLTQSDSTADGRAYNGYGPDPDESLLFCLELLEAGIAALQNDIEGLEAVRRAERHLHKLHPSRDTLPELWGLLAAYRSRLQLWAGEVHAARTSLDEVAAAARMAHQTGWEVSAHSQGAMLAAIVGDLGTALGLAERAEEQMQEQVQPHDDDVARVALARSWVLNERSFIGPARYELARADALVSTTETIGRGLLAIVRSRVLHAQGYYSAARTVLAGLHGAPLGTMPRWLADWMRVAHLVHESSEGLRQPTGSGLDGDLLDLAGWNGEAPLELRVTKAVLGAGSYLQEQNAAAAVPALARSLELAGSERMRRPFTEAPPAVRQLLRGTEEAQIRQPWLTAPDTTPAAAAGDPLALVIRQPGASHAGVRRRRSAKTAGRALTSGVRPLVEELTAKELELLGHVAELHTTDEIAAEMFISVNTVRTHVRNILRKLGVERRNQAVRRAWELGLLDEPVEKGSARL